MLNADHLINKLCHTQAVLQKTAKALWLADCHQYADDLLGAVATIDSCVADIRANSTVKDSLFERSEVDAAAQGDHSEDALGMGGLEVSKNG